MANKNLYLIGTIHTDFQGPRRLEGLLRNISPSILALEANKDTEHLMSLIKSPEEEEKEADQDLNEAGLILTPEQRNTLLETAIILRSVRAYELRTCKEYVQRNPETRLEYIDISLFENGKQEFVDGYNAISKGMLRQIAQFPEQREPFLEMLNKGKDEFVKELNEMCDIVYKNAEIMKKLVESLRSTEAFKMYKEHLPANAVQTLEQIYNPRRDEVMAKRTTQLYGDGSHRLAAVVGLSHMPGLISRMLDLEPTTMTLADYDNN